MTSRTGALSGPKALKVPGSPEWCWQTVQVLKEQMRHVREQWDLAEDALTALVEVQAWKKIPPEKPYGSLNAMVKAELGVSVQTVRNRITEARERAKRTAQDLHNGKSVTDGRTTRHIQESYLDNIKIAEGTTGGTSADYLARRIARDRPDILARMRAGEFKSIRAAALEAGILKPTAIVRTDSPTSAARTLRKHMTPEQCAELARLLTGEN